MNNITTSESSSGGESGWTTYWDQLSNSTDSNDNRKKLTYDDDDDDSLSIVSDASSGPRLSRNEDHSSSFSGDHKKTSKRKNNTKEDKKHNQFSLDDTATSPFFHSNQDNMGPNQNHCSRPVEHFEREPSPKKHLGSRKGKSDLLFQVVIEECRLDIDRAGRFSISFGLQVQLEILMIYLSDHTFLGGDSRDGCSSLDGDGVLGLEGCGAGGDCVPSTSSSCSSGMIFCLHDAVLRMSYIRAIAEEYAFLGFLLQFVTIFLLNVDVADTPKDS
ncbi:Unknown protein [Striga hermonthica]|uniref:Uncharacterized protein n=1 Tax=Striga hermonthica TaxID=68872 RepID=A0A9N7MNN1_STRHE|nr:Unknown protein [Striga hermonthica]